MADVTRVTASCDFHSLGRIIKAYSYSSNSRILNATRSQAPMLKCFSSLCIIFQVSCPMNQNKSNGHNLCQKLLKDMNQGGQDKLWDITAKIYHTFVKQTVFHTLLIMIIFFPKHYQLFFSNFSPKYSAGKISRLWSNPTICLSHPIPKQLSLKKTTPNIHPAFSHS